VCEVPDLQSLSSVQKSPSKCSPGGTISKLCEHSLR
jgi:hypothetical protein